MIRPFNTFGGGANTNRNGLEFERSTELRDAFLEHPRYALHGDTVMDRATALPVGVLFEKNKLYKNLLTARGVDYTQIVSKRLLPDGAVLVGGTLYIIEKKFQAGSGSVDEKLQTCHFKKRQYEKLKMFRKSGPKRAAGFFTGCSLVSRTISCRRRADSRRKAGSPLNMPSDETS